jgi:hypothetical protein
MNGFYKLKERLEQEGWFVGWGLPCCQSCAWGDVPYEFEEPHPFAGQRVDLCKVLFNHEQDCQIDIDEFDEETDEPILPDEYAGREYDMFPSYTPEEQKYSTFCFAGDAEGVKNLKAILPIIVECGCEWEWNMKGNQRIEISWLNT